MNYSFSSASVSSGHSDSVGLPAIFTLLAAILGGEILGVVGMIFAIPLTAVIYTLLRDMAYDKDERSLQMVVEECLEDEKSAVKESECPEETEADEKE